jgi:DNA-binding FadR family transcriptional regulator
VKLIELSLILGGLDIKMFFEAREVIEPGLAYLAAKHATKEQIDGLFQILDDQKAAFTSGDEELLHTLDLAIHQHIADMANNNFLSHINDVLFKNLDSLFRILPLTESGWVLHRIVADAIRDRVCEDAYSAMQALIRKSFTNYLPYLETSIESDNNWSEV